MLNSKRRRETPHATSNGNELQLKLRRNHGNIFRYDGFRLLDLPAFIIIEILTRTPIKDILHCRSVCKTLRSLIANPYFVKHFISKTPFLSLVLHSKNNSHFVKLGGSRKFASGYKKLKPMNTSFVKESYCLEIIGCSNGLICLWDKHCDSGKLYITNPALWEFAVLPNPKSDKYAAIKETYGFWFCPATGKYKLIKIKVRRAFLQSNQRGYYRKTEAWISDVGSDTWRYVGDAPYPRYGSLGRYCHVILNGRLHWMVDNNFKGPISLHSLDITEEVAHSVPAPHELRCENQLTLRLGVLGKSLCLFDNSQNNRVEIWSMREYGVATSWTKDCILTTSDYSSSLRPLTLRRNGMILMSSHCGSIVCYDPKEGKFSKVMSPIQSVFYKKLIIRKFFFGQIFFHFSESFLPLSHSQAIH